jgi:hypothetical protein
VTFDAANCDLVPVPGLDEAIGPLLAPIGFAGLVPVPSLAEAMRPLLAPMGAAVPANAFAGLVPVPSLAEAMRPLLAPMGAAVPANAFAGLVPVPSLAEAIGPLFAPMGAALAVNAFGGLTAIEPAETTSATEPGAIFSPEQERRLFAVYIYALTMSVVIWIYFAISTSSPVAAKVLSLSVFVAGLGGHQIAMRAVKYALQVYDRAFPQE